MKAIGCDLLVLPKFYKILQAYDEATLAYLFTADEFEQAKAHHDPRFFLSVSFAGKEAVSKALGQGMAGMRWTDIEIIPAPTASGQIRLHHRAKRLACRNRFYDWELDWELYGSLLCVRVDVS